jgi:hypothetical protein
MPDDASSHFGISASVPELATPVLYHHLPHSSPSFVPADIGPSTRLSLTLFKELKKKGNFYSPLWTSWCYS